MMTLDGADDMLRHLYVMMDQFSAAGVLELATEVAATNPEHSPASRLADWATYALARLDELIEQADPYGEYEEDDDE